MLGVGKTYGIKYYRLRKEVKAKEAYNVEGGTGESKCRFWKEFWAFVGRITRLRTGVLFP